MGTISPEVVNETFTSQADQPVADNTPEVKFGSFFVARAKSNLRRQLEAWRTERLSIGLVPTMGALHDGHLKLLQHARQRCDRVVASIFVNPTQFAEGEDLSTYPRTVDTDLEKLSRAGCDLAYLPQTHDIYPFGLPATRVEVPGLGAILEGVPRPHFFGGVTAVVARLFNHVRPDSAFFGEKDFQQLVIIQRMSADLGFDIEIVGVETVRDADGLAHSSRNRYLGPDARPRAGQLSAVLHRAARRINAGTPVDTAICEAKLTLASMEFAPVDYIELCDAERLAPVDAIAPERPARLLGAAWLDGTRLIDNVAVGRPA
jgi:pantoate--beta-alanine ligase